MVSLPLNASTLQPFNRSTLFMPYIELHACSAFSFLRGGSLPVLVASRLGYANLCSLLTHAHLRSSVKGESTVRREELPEFAQGLIALNGWGSAAAGCQPAASGTLLD